MIDRTTKIFLFLFNLGIILGALIGWAGTELYGDFKGKRVIDGLHFSNYDEEMVDEYTKNADSRGNWVCVNINGMGYERAVQVCQHEVGHEIFAEICEKNMTKCLGVME